EAARPLREAARQERRHRAAEWQERGVIRAEDLLALQRMPEVVKLLDAVREVALHRREVDGVDRAGGDAGDDLKLELGEVPGQTAQQSNLVGRARTAAGEHDRQVAAGLLGCRLGREVQFRKAHVLSHFKPFANFLASHAKAQPRDTMASCGSRSSAAGSTVPGWRGSWPAATTT